MTVIKNPSKSVENRHILAIGNFDGIHKGHQTIINYCVSRAQEQNISAGLLSFSPHPKRFFRPESDGFMVTSPDQKYDILNDMGLDNYFIQDFDGAFAQLRAQDFITTILVDAINVKEIVVGADFRFGHQRIGDIDLLRDFGAKHDFIVTVIGDVVDDQAVIYSSTSVRKAIHEGDLKTAHEMLGRDFEIEAVVVHGDKRGRELGYPTANMRLKDDTGRDYIHPKYGIYAVQFGLKNNDGTYIWHDGVANLGTRPMFKTPQPLLETFIFNFDTEIYDQTARVRLKDYIRPEMKFDNLDDLIVQMDKDTAQAKKLLISG